MVGVRRELHAEYTVLEERSGNGAECENATGVIGECEAGEGLWGRSHPSKTLRRSGGWQPARKNFLLDQGT